MAEPPTTHWSYVRVEMHDRAIATTLTGPARLAALVNWRRGHAPPSMHVIDHPADRPLTSPEDVDWIGFPTTEAIHQARDEEALLVVARRKMAARRP